MTDWIDVGALEDVPRQGSRTVKVGGKQIAVFRTDDDRIFALVDRCPHKAGPLSQGIVHGCRVTCPLHGFVIDLASGEAIAPDKGGTPALPVRLVGERIELDVRALRRRASATVDAH